MGSATLISEKGFWGSNISKLHKLCFLNGLLYYLATSIVSFLFVSPMMMYLSREGFSRSCVCVFVSQFEKKAFHHRVDIFAFRCCNGLVDLIVLYAMLNKEE